MNAQLSTWPGRTYRRPFMATAASRLSSGTLAKTLALVTLVTAGVMSVLVDDARGQSNSGLFAYPSGFNRLDQYNRAGGERELTFLRLPGLSPDYRLGPGDQIEVTIVGISSDPTTYTIDRTGEAIMPLVGGVKLADLTAEEAESAIASRLVEAQLIRDPEVLVYISSYEAKPVYVLGELDRQGQYFISQDLTLMDLILLAGGLDFTAARYGFLHRRTSQNDTSLPPHLALENAEVALPGMEVLKIDLKPMAEGGVLSPNYRLKAGDILVVPKAESAMFYVIGEVPRPGVFNIPVGGTVTASQAISWAGGPSRTARISHGMVVRHDRNGGRTELPVDFAAILRGDDPDFVVQPDDIIFIPDSGAKSFGYTMLQQVPRVLTGAILFRW
jgi:polysaccharide biosynthesis/export protein